MGRNWLIVFSRLMSLSEVRADESPFVLLSGVKRKPFSGHSTGGTLFNHVRLGQAAGEMTAENGDGSKS